MSIMEKMRRKKGKVLLLLMMGFLFTAGGLHAQELNKGNKITYECKQQSLSTVLRQLERLSNYYRIQFVYEDVDKQKVSVSLKGATMQTALNDVLKGTRLRYSVNNRFIQVYEGPQQGSTALATPGRAGTHTIQGKVVDISGDGMPSVTIKVKGSNSLGIVSDINGNFSLSVPQGGPVTLEFSYIGMETTTYVYTNKKNESNVTVSMRENTETLDNVVVTGIYRRNVESFTGSATTFSDKELKQVGNGNVLQSLKTLDPSFNLMDNNIMGSDPNQTLQIEVRGKTNVTGLTEEYVNDPNQPLFILDGFESTLSTISDLSMDRVQSITILKDAAATAIYGSKAANGVVVVETKAPEAGKLRVNYNGNLNLTWADLTDYNLMNSREKLEFEKLADGYGPIDEDNGLPYIVSYLEKYNERAAEIARGVDTYWLSEPLRFAVSHRHNVYVEGGDKSFRYGVGANIGNTEGVMKGSDRKVANGNIKLIYRKGKFAFTNNTNFDYTKADHESVAFSAFAQSSPYTRKYDENGDIIKIIGYTLYNEPIYSPVYNWLNNNLNTSKTTGFTNNFETEWRPIEELRARIKFGISNSNGRSKIFKSPFNSEYMDTAAEERGSYTETNTTTWNYDGDASLSYGQLLADKHQVNAIIGARLTKGDTEASAFRLKGFVDDDIISAEFAQSYNIGSRSTTDVERRTASYYANLNYAFDNRYLLDASWRKDGSSVFGVNKHFTDTWSVGLGWNLHNERFMKHLRFINYLKIRASIGNPGNQNFSDYISMNIFAYNSSYPTPWGSSILISKYGNDNLKWQKTIDQNLGADLYVLNHRLRVNFDIFRKNTDPLLITMSLPSSTGATGIPTNMGTLLTTGYTIQANYQIIKKHDFIWSVNANLRHLHSEYRDMGDALENFNKENQSKSMTRYYDGASPSDLWTVRSAGIDPATGKEVYYKKDGTVTYDYDYDDEVVCGNSEPDFEGVIGTSFYYKGFSFSANLRYRYGGQEFMSALYNKVENITYTSMFYNQDRRALYDRWQQPGDLAKFKGIDIWEVSPMSSRFVRDNNVLRGESFSVGYETEAAWLKKIGASSMTFRAYMNDLFNISSIKEERGTSYPFARSISFSLGLRF